MSWMKGGIGGSRPPTRGVVNVPNHAHRGHVNVVGSEKGEVAFACDLSLKTNDKVGRREW